MKALSLTIQKFSPIFIFLKTEKRTKKCTDRLGKTIYIPIYRCGDIKTIENAGNYCIYFGHNAFLHVTLSQTTNFRLFRTERVCRRKFQV